MKDSFKRLAWMERHRITTEHRPRAKKPEEVWKAWSANYTAHPSVGYGQTEEEACRDWGVRAKQTLWNELP